MLGQHLLHGNNTKELDYKDSKSKDKEYSFFYLDGKYERSC
jgi:hypothetical protein